MPKRCAAYILLSFLSCLAASAVAAVPQNVNYQGKLADASGNPLTGTYSFQFRLCTDANAADNNCVFTEIWSNANGTGPNSSVSVVNGIYNVTVGSFTTGGIPEALIEGYSQLYLEVSVLAGAGAVSGCSPGNSSPAQCQTLSPREPLSSSLWAIHALSSEKLAVGSNVATMTASGFVSFPSGAAFAGGVTASSATLTNVGGYSLQVSSGIVMSGPALFSAPTSTITAAEFIGNGSGLTGLNGTLSGGTLNDVALWSGANTLTTIPALGNGGLIIGAVGGAPSTGTIAGTSPILVTNSAGAIGVSLTAVPSTLLPSTVAYTSSLNVFTASQTISGTNTVLVSSGITTVAGNAGLFVSTSLYVNGIITGNGSGLTGLNGTLSGGTLNDVALWSGANTLTTIPALGNGGLIIGAVGGAPSTGTIAGTSPILVTNSAGAIGVSLTAVPSTLLPSTVAYTSSLNIFTASQTISGTNTVLVSSGIATTAGNAGLFVSTSLYVSGNESVSGNLSVAGTITGNVNGTVSGSVNAYQVNAGSFTGANYNFLGNVGVSTGTAFQGLFQVGNGTLTVTSSGNVGISSSAPVAPLVVGAQNAAGFTLQISSSIKTGGCIQFADGTSECTGNEPNAVGATGWTAANAPVIQLQTPTNNVVVQSTLTVSGNAFSVGGSTFVVSNGNIGFGAGSNLGHVSIGVSSLGNPAAGLQLQDFAANTNYFGLGLDSSDNTAFWTWTPGNNFQESLLLTRAGNFGIGALPPNAVLEVSSAAASASTSLLIVSTGSAPGQRLFAVQAGGNVGVGTAAPLAKLDVAGNELIEAGSILTSSGIATVAGNAGLFVSTSLYVSGTIYGNVNGTVTGNVSANQVNAGAFQNSGAYSFPFTSASAPGVTISSGLIVQSGLVGISTGLPQAPLDVESAVNGFTLQLSSSIKTGGCIQFADGTSECTGNEPNAVGATGWTAANAPVVQLQTPSNNVVIQSSLTVQGPGGLGVGYGITAATAVLTGGAFSVGGGTLAVQQGLVAIGTSTPLGIYSTILGGLTPTALTVEEDANSNGIQGGALFTTYGANSAIGLLRADGSRTAPSQVLNGESIGRVAFFGYGATGFNGVTRALDVVAAESFTDASNATDIHFQTTPIGRTVSQTQMTIAHTGNVGISTAAPAAALDVENAGANEFIVGGSTLVATNGNVGIGTANPLAALDVEGLNAVLISSGIKTVPGNAGLFVSTSLYVSGNESVSGNLSVAGTITGNVNGTVSGSVNAYQVNAGSFTGANYNFLGNVGVSTGTAFQGLFQVGNGTLTVTSSGNVGISSAAPVAPLVVGTQNAAGFSLRLSSSIATGGCIQFADGTSECTGAEPNAIGATGWTAANAPVIQLQTPTNNVVVQSTLTVSGNAFSVGGSTFVVSNGNVGIGTIGPGTQKLTINPGANNVTALGITDSAGGGNKFAFSLDPGGNSTLTMFDNGGGLPKFSITTAGNAYWNVAGGNWGIGTTAPNAKLDIEGANAVLMSSGIATVAGNAGLFVSTSLYVSGNESVSGNLSVAGTITGNVQGTVTGNVNAYQVNAGSFQAGNYNFPGNIGVSTGTAFQGLFQVGNGTLTVTSAGNVGIGTSLPAYTLDVGGQSAVRGNLNLLGANNTEVLLNLGVSGNAPSRIVWNGGSVNYELRKTDTGSTPLWNFGIQGDANPAMTINAAKNVGIGTTGPQATLEISSAASSATTPLLAVDTGTAVGNIFRVTAGGNVGVGTANPTNNLYVQGGETVTGNLNVSGTITGTVNGTVSGNVNAYQVNIGSFQAGAYSFPGNATFVTSATVSGSAFSVGTSTLVVTGGMVGIGTAGPRAGLDVEQFQSGQVLVISTSPATPLANTAIRVDSNGSTFLGGASLVAGQGTGGIGIMTGGLFPLASLGVGGGVAIGSSYATASNSPSNGAIIQGGVGIGTASPSPSAKLDVAGNVLVEAGNILTSSGIATVAGNAGLFVSTSLYVSGNESVSGNLSVAGTITGNVQGTVTGNVNAYQVNAGSFQAGNYNFPGNIGVSTGTAFQGLFQVGNGTLTVTSAGNVGIGTTVPVSTLDVAGIISPQFGIVAGGLGNGTAVGSARGAGAIDLQTYRTSAGQVASGNYAAIGGGQSNSAGGPNATVAGGQGNSATDHGTVGGGLSNSANFTGATVAGGENNQAANNFAAVGGGLQNTAGGSTAFVGGGQLNSAGGPFAAVGGGYQNTAGGNTATVGGGYQNTAGNTYATVPGGYRNFAMGPFSFAAGALSSATTQGSFVWADSNGGSPLLYQDKGPDTFNIRAQGGFIAQSSSFTLLNQAGSSALFYVSGASAAINQPLNVLGSTLAITSAGNVGIGTASPNYPLDVYGNVHSTGVFYGNGSGLTNLPGGASAWTLSAPNLYELSYNVGVGSIPASGVGFAVGPSSFVVLQNGNVGIGTASPNNLFQVNGFIKFDDAHQSTFFGTTAGNSNTTGSLNSAVGYQALFSNTTGSGNTANGYQALNANASGLYNTAIGAVALTSNVSGKYNTATGVNALVNITAGNYNTAEGYNAGFGPASISFSSNSLFGASAGYGLTTGSNNTFLGVGAGANETAGSNDIVIGANQNVAVPGTGNFLNIGGVLYGTGLGSAGANVGISSIAPQGLFVVGNGTMVVTSAGNVGVGTANPTNNLYVQGGETVTGNLNVSGTITGTVNGTVSGNVNAYQVNAGSFQAGNYNFPGNATFVTSATVSGSAFSVGGSTLVVTGGVLGLGSANPLVDLATSPIPSAHLDVVGDFGGSGQQSGALFTGYGAYPLIFGRLANGSAASPTPVAINNNLLQISAGGYGNTGWSGNSGTIFFTATENWSGGGQGTKIRFSTTQNGSTAASTRMTVDNNGNVGVGVTAPAATLHISSGASNGSTLLLEVSTGSGAGQQLMVVQANGNVGLGTASPNAALDIEGANAVLMSSGIATVAGSAGLFVSTSLYVNGTLYGNGSGLTGLSGTLTGGSPTFLPYWVTSTSLGNTNVTYSGGNVGVSSAAPQGLFVVGSGTMVVTAAGNVGIGTASPDNLLQVNGLINFDNSKSSTFIGYQDGNSNSGTNDTAVGYQALSVFNTGNYNTAVGWQALNSNSGHFNTASGAQALSSNGGNNNTASGYQTLNSNAGSDNTAIGYQALFSNANGGQNTAVGSGALSSTINGSNNSTAVGYQAGKAVTAGANNTFIGWSAGNTVTTGTNDLILGYNQQAPSASQSNFLNLGGVLYGTGLGSAGANVGISSVAPQGLFVVGNGTMVVTSAGSVGIGTAGPLAPLDVEAKNASGYSLQLSSGINMPAGTVNAGLFIGNGAGLTGLSGTLSGGSMNAVPYWTSSTALGNSNLTYSGGNIGVSSAAPQGLFVVGSGTMVVTSAGSVGVGTASPLAPLDVEAKNASGYSLQLSSGINMPAGAVNASLSQASLAMMAPVFEAAPGSGNMVTLQANANTTPGGTGGNVQITAGGQSNGGLGGSVTLTSGLDGSGGDNASLTVFGAGSPGGNTGQGGGISIAAGNGSTQNNGNGGIVNIYGGSATQAGRTGGNIVLTPGLGPSTGTVIIGNNAVLVSSAIATVAGNAGLFVSTSLYVSGGETVAGNLNVGGTITGTVSGNVNANQVNAGAFQAGAYSVPTGGSLGVSTSTVFQGLFEVGSGTMVVTSAGNVGIGTAAPLSKLDVEGAAGANYAIQTSSGVLLPSGAPVCWGAGNCQYAPASGVGLSISVATITAPSPYNGVTFTTAAFFNSGLTFTNLLTRSGNTAFGNQSATHVNLGNGSTTGINGQNFAYATVGGGTGNTAASADSVVAGGQNNTAGNAGGGSDAILGGSGNQALGGYSAVAGGFNNQVNGNGLESFIGGGLSNSVTSNNATVGGGSVNNASGQYSTIPGGANNAAAGNYSLAAGNRAKANHQGAFVWADSTAADFASTANDQFLIRAGGGVGISTPAPVGLFTVGSGSMVVTTAGNVGLGTAAPGTRLDVEGASGDSYLQIWRNSSGVTQASMSATGILYGNGSGLTNLNVAASNIPAEISLSTIDASASTPHGGVYITSNAFIAGNLGLGTFSRSDPSIQLQLTGNLGIPTSGLIYQGTVPLLVSNHAGTDNNTFAGTNAGNLTLSGTLNTGVGNFALQSLTSGGGNAALGVGALADNFVGNSNTAVGYGALHNNNYNQSSGGSNNTAVGNNAGYGLNTTNTNFANNSLFGANAGQLLNTGSADVFLGYNSGQSARAANNAILIGSGTDDASDTSNFLNIGNALYGNLATGNIGIASSTPQGLFAVGNGTMVVTANGNVGIGTTNPAVALEVSKNSTGVGYGQYPTVTVNNPNASGIGAFLLYSGATQAGGLQKNTDNSLFLYAQAAMPLEFGISSVEKMRIDSSGNIGIASSTPQGLFTVGNGTMVVTAAGNVGIGTASPQYALDVYGNVHSTGVFYGNGSGLTGLNGTLSGGTTGAVPYWTSSTALGNSNITSSGSNIGIASSTPQGLFVVGNGTMVVTAAGNVGISTAAPGAPLHIAGKTNAAELIVQAASGQSPNNPMISLNDASGNPLLPITSDKNSDLFMGVGAGVNNFGSSNIFIGPNAGNLNTSGNHNIAIGNALGGNSSDNAAVGFNALANGSGGQSAAFGSWALQSNSASANTAVGYSALQSNTSGANNTALGWEAGWTNGANPNTTGSNDTFLGSNAGATASNLSNATAIGANATVGASNALVLGSGVNVGISTAAPQAKLDIEGAGSAYAILASSSIHFNTAGTGIVWQDGSISTTAVSGGGGATVGGTAGQVQYNNGTTFAGAANLVYVGNNVGVSSATPQGLFVVGNATMVVTSAGNVGISSASPQGLLVVGSGAAPALTVTSGGSVGIGTAIPDNVFQAANYIDFTSGGTNAIVGNETSCPAVTGTRNAAYGNNAGCNLGSAANNVLIGDSAGLFVSGNYNTVIGQSAGNHIGTTGAANIIIGAGVGFPSNSGNNQLDIGNLIYGVNVGGTLAPSGPGAVGISSVPASGALFVVGQSSLTVLQGGNVGIGTAAPGAKLDVEGAAGSAYAILASSSIHFNTAGTGIVWQDGSISTTAAAGGGSWTNTGNDYTTGTLGVSTNSVYAGIFDVGNGTLTVTASGNVGIGTTAPNNALQVANLINFDSANPGAMSLGYQAGNSNAAQFNTFVGYQAGFSNTTGRLNTFLGYQAGYNNNTTGGTDGYNSFLGYRAGFSNTTGNRNAFLGYGAGYNNTTGIYNTFLGAYEPGYFNSTGSSNTAVGYAAGFGTVGSAYSGNTLIGYQSGYNLTSGSSNTFIGAGAGQNETTGGNDIVIGDNQGVASPGTGNFLNIGGLIYGTGLGTGSANVGIASTTPQGLFVVGSGGTPGLLVTAAGNVGIGTAAPGAKLDVNGNAAIANSQNLNFRNASGALDANINEDAGNSLNIGGGSGNQYIVFNVAGLNVAGIDPFVHGMDVGLVTSSLPGLLNVTGHGGAANDKFTLYVSTNPSGTNLTYNLVVSSSSGNVGIGTSSPAAALDVEGAAGSAYAILASSSIHFNTAGTGIVWQDGSISTTAAMGGGGATVGGTSGQVQYNNGTTFAGAANLVYSGGNVGVSSATPNALFVVGTATMVATSAGTVGIGTAVPGSALDVQGGNINTSGAYLLKGGTVLAVSGPSNFSLSVGKNAGPSNTGTNNLFVGYNAGILSTSGADNTFMGFQAGGAANTTGNDNSYVGYNAGQHTTSGARNTAVGSLAGDDSTGADNVAVGYGANAFGSTGSQNVVLGSKAGGYNSGPAFSNSTFVGYQAGINLAAGSNNSTFVGASAGSAVTSGSNDVFLGYNTGANETTGSGDIVIGTSQNVAVPGEGNFLDIGGAIYGRGLGLANLSVGIATASTQGLFMVGNATMVVTSAGNVGVGTIGPAQKLEIQGGGLAISSSAVSGTSLFVSSTTGAVGVGTASPGYTLDVNSPALTPVRLNGLLMYGAATNAQLRTLACPAIPCQANSTTDFDIYTATGTLAGQWRNERLGIGP